MKKQIPSQHLAGCAAGAIAIAAVLSPALTRGQSVLEYVAVIAGLDGGPLFLVGPPRSAPANPGAPRSAAGHDSAVSVSRPNETAVAFAPASPARAVTSGAAGDRSAGLPSVPKPVSKPSVVRLALATLLVVGSLVGIRVVAAPGQRPTLLRGIRPR